MLISSKKLPLDNPALITAIILCLVSTSLPANAHGCQSLQQLNWMLGTWVSHSSNQKTTETWWQVSDSTFEGEGLSISDNKTNQETLRIVQMSDHIFYFAKVASNPLPVPFKLVACSSNQATFANPQHDFPTQLRYQLSNNGLLNVHVSGPDGNGFTIEFQKQSGH
ncbi:DUF6265 family protein [Aliiglaciecola sp.]|nr:DUF6265 family protein [Aliiglaciecola sp.]